MMFIDTSAIVALLTREPAAEIMPGRVDAAERRITAPHVRLESAMVPATRLGLDPQAVAPAYDALLKEANRDVVPIDDATAQFAFEAFARYGTVRHPKAKLNFGDCLSYAVASKAGWSILFVGDGFFILTCTQPDDPGQPRKTTTAAGMPGAACLRSGRTIAAGDNLLEAAAFGAEGRKRRSGSRHPPR